MKIKQSKFSSKKYILFIPILLVLILWSISIKNNNSNSSKLTKFEQKQDIEKETVIDLKSSVYDIIKNELNIIHKDSICSVYLVSEYGTPIIIFDYKDKLTLDELYGRFKLRVVLKDKSKLNKKSSSPSINLDFNARPHEVEIDKEKHFVFKKALTNELLELENIDYLNIGRYNNNKKSINYNVNNIFIKDIKLINVTGLTERIEINIKDKSFEKIKAKRLAAFRNKILITKDDDEVSAVVNYKDNPNIKVKIRLKGDITDHLNDPKKWSFRITANGEKTVNGLRKFSIQHPKTRHYLWEWLFNKVVKHNGLIGIKYEFLDVNINVEKKNGIESIPLGIMAFEESFDKIMIENNSRREGLLFGIDDTTNWLHMEKQNEFNLSSESRGNRVFPSSISHFKVFNESKILSDPKLKKQFNTAIDLLDGLRLKKLKISEVFDVDKLAMYVALSNLFGGGHGIRGSNIRLYYNPIINRFEPVSWDSSLGNKLTKLEEYSLHKIDDEIYSSKLIEKLELVSSSEFINNLVTEFNDDLTLQHMNLYEEYKNQCNLDLSVLEYNSNFIKQKIYPAKPLISSIVSYNDTEMVINVENLSYDLPLEISGLTHVDGKKLTKKNTNQIIIPEKSSKKITFKLDDAFINAFVSKKNKKGEFRFPKDLEKIAVQFNMLGQKHKREERIIPYSISSNLDDKIAKFRADESPNFKSYKFISTSKDKKEIVFKSGSYVLDKTMVIPSGYNLIFEKGFNLNFMDNASLISSSSIECNGSKEAPIRFYSSDSSGGGIFITNAEEKSIVSYTTFSNLSNPNSEIWELSGAVNFHETEVEIRNSVFEENRCEDGLNIIRSKFIMDSNIFKNTKSDAFDGDFVDGTIANCQFINSGNDGVDVSGSNIVLNNIIFENPSDKAVSAGENSTIAGNNININGGEIGIVSKDLSKVDFTKVTINETRLGFSSFQKKSEFGPGKITISNLKMTNNETDYLIETGSSLTIDNIVASTVSNKVIDQMYGKEYGKSSK